MASKKIKVGLVGLGGISYSHEAGYNEVENLAEITAVCDVDKTLALGRALPYQAKVYTDFGDLARDPEIDLVDICLPHRLHYPAALAALENKKHILVEKPIAQTSVQALDLVERARQAGVWFSVAENTRFVTAYQVANQVLRRGDLGQIRMVHTWIAGSEAARIKDPASWVGKQADGGVILDSGVHTCYLLQWLFGGVRQVQAFADQIIPEGEVEDTATLIGQLANGARFVSGVTCSAEVPWTERLEVYGSQGSLIIDQLCNPPAILYNGSEDIDGTPLEGVQPDLLAWKYLSIVEEVKDFVRAISENRPPTIDPLDAVAALKVVEAAYASIHEGQVMVV